MYRPLLRKKFSHSLELFFRKVLQLARLRCKELCTSLGLDNVLQPVWQSIQQAIRSEWQLMYNRHLDQLVMCSIYGVCRVKKLPVTFKGIIEKYKQMPHAHTHLYRHVDLSVFYFICDNSNPQESQHGQAGDIIQFYNDLYIPAMKSFIMQFAAQMPLMQTYPPVPGYDNSGSANSNEDMDDGLQPQILQQQQQRLLMSPPKRISAQHNLFVSPLKSQSINTVNTTVSPQMNLTPRTKALYYLGESPSKDLVRINRAVNKRADVENIDDRERKKQKTTPASDYMETTPS